MLYASAPQGKLSKPVRVLAGFAKTGLLPSGGSETVEITAPVRTFASYDDDGRTWIHLLNYQYDEKADCILPVERLELALRNVAGGQPRIL